MHYKVVIVTEKTACCGGGSDISQEIERESNRWSGKGYILVTAYQQHVAGCGNQSSVGAVLIFVKQ
jgi:hypothetical protein